MSKEFEDIAILILIMSLLFVIFAATIIVSVFRFKQKQQKHIKEKKELQSQFAETLLESQLEIKEQTLQHIAYELHDNLGQMASLIKINLNTIQLNDAVSASLKLEDTKDLVRQLITDLKVLSISLNSNRVAQLGLLKGLENEVERLNKLGLIDASLPTSGEVPLFDANTTIILYRMVQEIINNVVKHSNAKQVVISLKTTENLFTLVCNDNGVGFNTDEKLSGGGSGLINLQNRAKVIGAKILIKSSPENGTTVTIELPLEKLCPLQPQLDLHL